jgi:hypothetical protein
MREDKNKGNKISKIERNSNGKGKRESGEYKRDSMGGGVCELQARIRE